MKISDSSGERSWQSASFPGKRHAVQRALAADKFPRATGGFPRTGGFNSLSDNALGERRALFQELAQAVVNQRLDDALHFAVSQLGLGLTFELGLRQLHADDADQAFANVVAGQVLFEFLEEIVRDGVVVQRAGQRGLEADQVRAALVRVDVVGESENLFLIAVVVLHGDFKIDPFLDALKVDNFVVEWGLVLVEVLDERNDPAGVVKIVSSSPSRSSSIVISSPLFRNASSRSAAKASRN